MAKTTIKQHDITDCGAACLASITAHYNLQIPIARIRQYAGTDKKGTNVLGLIEAVHEFYVTKIEFLPNLKKQKKSEDFSFKRNSNYKGKYWEEFTTHKFFKQLPSVLEKAIESKLTELKNLDH